MSEMDDMVARIVRREVAAVLRTVAAAPRPAPHTRKIQCT